MPECAFFSLKTKRPYAGEIVLCKLNDAFTPFYICEVCRENEDEWGEDDREEEGKLIFTEASGEQYSSWEENEVIGWMPVEVFKTIPVV